MRHLKTTLAVLGAVTILVLAGNTISMAATGHAFILGKGNSANKQTTLSRTTNGPVLKLNAKKATGVPLAVRGNGKVANLNADKVDGVDSSTLKTTAYVFKADVTAPDNSVVVTIPVPNGTYTVSYSAYLIGAANTGVDCYLEQNPPGLSNSTYMAESRFTAGASTPGLTGTGFMTKTTDGVLTLDCSAGANFTTSEAEPIQILATRVDSVATNTTIPAARVAQAAKAR